MPNHDNALLTELLLWDFSSESEIVMRVDGFLISNVLDLFF